MREQGVVVEVKKSTATVRIDKKDECSKCGMCIFPKGASSVDFDADNKLGATVGQTVVIDTEKDGKLLGALLVFLVPLLLIGISVLIGLMIIESELSVLALSVALIVVWFAILSLIDKKLKKTVSFRPQIVEILTKE